MKKIFALLLVLFTIFLSQSPMVIEAQPNETQLDQELHATDRIYLPLINKTDRPPRERTILRNYYIEDPVLLFNLGCKTGQYAAGDSRAQSYFLYLQFYRALRDANAIYGASDYRSVFWSLSDISNHIIQIANGFVSCNQNDTLYISTGVTSYGLQSEMFAFDHGFQWAQMINETSNILYYQGMLGRVFAIGGANIEPYFNTKAITNQWLDGYEGFPIPHLIYIAASADGCPNNWPPLEEGSYYPSNCSNGWTQKDLADLFVIRHLTRVFPEIYRTDGYNASQWYRIALFSYYHSRAKIPFFVTLTQSAACEQRGGCPGADNQPEVGYGQLYQLLESDIERMANYLNWASDIKWYSGTP